MELGGGPGGASCGEEEKFVYEEEENEKHSRVFEPGVV
jgi:hypothetical protein